MHSCFSPLYSKSLLINLLPTVSRYHAQLLLKGRLQTLQIMGTLRCRILELGSPVGQQLLEPGGVFCNTLLSFIAPSLLDQQKLPLLAQSIGFWYIVIPDTRTNSGQVIPGGSSWLASWVHHQLYVESWSKDTISSTLSSSSALISLNVRETFARHLSTSQASFERSPSKLTTPRLRKAS
ncbi:unnamed protein product [Linum trigynum]|uniref:Uncharacterized protein n=1 Tax=Linum trigynum TaxID=586398 RepID=A0AAV2D819_9ROSI